MHIHFPLLVVIPVGPTCQLAFIEDTLASIRYYVHVPHKIIIADDSHAGTGDQIKQKHPDIDVVATASPMGKLCGLYITLSMAFKHAISHYTFDCLLRMDTDALITGEDPEASAIKLFRENPGIGIAGQFPLDYHGKPWDTEWPRTQIWRIFHTKKFFRRPIVHLALLKYYLKAKKHGYERGDSVFGGACFYSQACIQALDQHKLLPAWIFKTLVLEEDHLFTLLIKAIGFNLGTLSGSGLPVGCAWRGLPASPQSLQKDGKKIVHSTRFWKDINEPEIREWFREKRRNPL